MHTVYAPIADVATLIKRLHALAGPADVGLPDLHPFGTDITEWPGYSDLADMREIVMTSWLSKKADTSPAAAAEAVKRIDAVRTGGSRRDCGAY